MNVEICEMCRPDTYVFQTIFFPRQLNLSSQAIGYSVERGEVIARENGYSLLE